MRRLKCSSCAAEFPAGDMFHVDGAEVCERCGDRLLAENKAKSKDYQPHVWRLTDPTVCSRCKTDYGDKDLPVIGGMPFCANCIPGLYAHPFPVWLKASFSALLVVLAVGLWRGVPYFAAGRHLAQGRRAMDRRDYQTATTHFAAVLPVKPTDQDVVLQGAKAHLMTGDAGGASAFLELRASFEENALFTEVNGLWDRANAAFKKAEDAGKLAESNRTAEALRLMTEAAREYPQSVALAVAVLSLKGGEAFERKDYDAMLAASREALALVPDNPGRHSAVASALACKYAVTGNSAFRVEAEQLLARAESLAAGSPEAQASLDEYAERIRYRLTSRMIIDKDEYDRRFRAKSGKP
jgi:tetratricopeptide (TPR) repeat protein/DNA-directed RNA polymerase subunit RPC12/RpoP